MGRCPTCKCSIKAVLQTSNLAVRVQFPSFTLFCEYGVIGRRTGFKLRYQFWCASSNLATRIMMVGSVAANTRDCKSPTKKHRRFESFPANFLNCIQYTIHKKNRTTRSHELVEQSRLPLSYSFLLQ